MSMGGPRFKSSSVQNFDICINFNSKALPSTLSLEAHTLVASETKVGLYMISIPWTSIPAIGTRPGDLKAIAMKRSSQRRRPDMSKTG